LEESERPNLVIAVDSNMDGTPEEYWLARDGEPVGVVVAPADADPGADRSAPVVEPPREDDDLGVIGTIELMGKLGWLGVNIAWDEAKEELEDLWPF